MPRRALSQENFVRMLLAQGAVIPCGCCKKPITDAKNIRREHLNEYKISDDDSVGNQQLWHAYPCSHKKTNGTKATTLGSSKHIIAKAKRLEAEHLGINRPRQSRLARDYAFKKRILALRKETT
jgi:hypothetical protein